MDILTIIVGVLFLSLVFNLILKKFHISPIVGYILTGSTVVTFMDFANINRAYLSHVAEFGIVFLMFTIGLEFSVNHLKQMKKEVFVFGSLQVIITSLFFIYLSHVVFKLDITTSIVIGSALALSSTAIVLKVLNDNGDIHRPYGRNSVGILIFQDLSVIPILLMITMMSNSSISLEDMLLNTLYSAIFVGIVLYLLGKYIADKFLAYVVDTKVEELFIASILLIVLSSALFAHTFGFSYSLGAFLAGMLIAETKYKYQIEADLVPFRDILLGIFFITVGMQVDFAILLEHYILIILLLIAILSIKVILIFLIIRLFTFTKRAIKTALTLAQVGEFSFAVFSLASANHLISNDINQIMITVVMLSLLFTSLVLRHVRCFTDFFYKESSELIQEPIASANMKEHIIVCGYSSLGQKIVKQLRNLKLSYVAVEHNGRHVKTGHERGDMVFFGNASSQIVLNSLCIKDASAVIIAVDNDEKIRLICEAIRDITPKILIALKVTHQSQIDDFRDLNIDSIINENEVVASWLVKKIV
ncbi:Glutathione-regulated potassium-efflux system protein KefB [hydrothermal vent metagenome]|uniref:Glutathione-regulated potassium-efflux system protein KefB n=1 Tax=hydrothermal vent metagenome TaxID=652676 RepID=A0A3B1DT64_9ZZZZ